MPAHETTRTGPPSFGCRVERDGERVRLCPAGEVDMATVPLIEEHVGEALSGECDHLVLDLREVTFLDSSGLRLVLTLEATSRADGYRFSLIRGPERVWKVFEVAGVARRLSVVEP